MAKARASALRAIHRFMELAERKIDIQRVILFGSQVSGHPSKWSDVDIAVVSNDFEGMSPRERDLLLGKIAWEQKVTEIDALGYTDAEFTSENPLDLVTEIKARGIVVYEKPGDAGAQTHEPQV